MWAQHKPQQLATTCTKTKQNKTKRDETRRNETRRNKKNKTKQNKTKQKKTKQKKQNNRKQKKTKQQQQQHLILSLIYTRVTKRIARVLNAVDIAWPYHLVLYSQSTRFNLRLVDCVRPHSSSLYRASARTQLVLQTNHLKHKINAKNSHKSREEHATLDHHIRGQTQSKR